jgi:FtsP/CotA-like multicopper oxidase with cupredoxin domain
MHPMHLHGIPQTVIAKDGFPLPQPYKVDTLTIAPGERYTVAVQPTTEHLGADGKPGVWAFHCHILTHAESSQGMFGMVTTFIVQK